MKLKCRDETDAIGFYFNPDKSMKSKDVKSKVTCVYFAPMIMEPGFKIGISSNPKSRLFKISWDDETYLFDMFSTKHVQVIPFNSYAEAHKAEQNLHAHYGRDRHGLSQKHENSCGKTEYFSIEIFDECIQYAASLYGMSGEPLYNEVDLDQLDNYENDVDRYHRETELFSHLDRESIHSHADLYIKLIAGLSVRDIVPDCEESAKQRNAIGIEAWKKITIGCLAIHNNFAWHTPHLYKPNWDKDQIKIVDVIADMSKFAISQKASKRKRKITASKQQSNEQTL